MQGRRATDEARQVERGQEMYSGGEKLEKAARRRPAYSQMIRLQVCAAPHIKSHLGLLDVGG